MSQYTCCIPCADTWHAVPPGDTWQVDQYTLADTTFQGSEELHRHLYGDATAHPGPCPQHTPPMPGAPHQSKRGVHYIVVCKVLLGYPARTDTGVGKRNSDWGGLPISKRVPIPCPRLDPPKKGESVFPVNYRELAPVGGLPPSQKQITHHSLIGEMSKGGDMARYREFVVFNNKRILPIYLVAYKRTKKMDSKV